MIAGMPALDLETSRRLLNHVVQALFARRHSPVPGAVIKSELIRAADEQGLSFNERELGFKNFVEFVRGTPGISVQIRTGSDMLVAPSTAVETLSAYARPLSRLRRDFWRAFIEFPVANTVRLYDASEDKILYEDAATERKGILIEPISRDTQLQWRRRFAEEQPDNVKDALLSALNSDDSSSFNDFARRLRENPGVAHAWNRYLQKFVTDYVAKWATTNSIPAERWSGDSGRTRFDGTLSEVISAPRRLSQRAELYNLLDSVPIEDLLELRVPLDWVLKVTRDKR
jgi:hypothetical protein